MIPGLYVGAIVHYVGRGKEHWAALVTALGEDEKLGEVELQVAEPYFGWRHILEAFYSPDVKQVGTWHFIEQPVDLAAEMVKENNNGK